MHKFQQMIIIYFEGCDFMASSISSGSLETNYSSSAGQMAVRGESSAATIKRKNQDGANGLIFNKTKEQWTFIIIDKMIFYTTAFFVLLVVVALVALIFLVPFFIDPAWSTLKADFDSQGVQCTTVTGQYLEGN